MEVKLEQQNARTISSVIRPVLDHPAFKAAGEVATQAAKEVTLCGISGSGKALVTAGLAHELLAPGPRKGGRSESSGRLARPIVVITADNQAADRLAEDASTYLYWLEGADAASRIGVLPAFDCSPYDGRSPHPEIAQRRAVVLWKLARGLTDLLLVPVSAVLGRFRNANFYRSLALEIKAGDELSLDDLVEHLATVGYESREPVSEVGEYSVRGGIIDLFPPQSGNPLRLEFFGDQVESLREFDPSSQRSQKAVPSALLLPISESARSPGFFSRLTGILSERLAHGSRPASTISTSPVNLRGVAEGAGAATSQNENPSETKLETSSLPDTNPVREPDWAPEYSGTFPGWEFFVPLVEPHPNTLFSLVAEREMEGHSLPGGNSQSGPLVIWDEGLDRKQDIKRMLENWAAGFDEVRDIVPPRPTPQDIFLDQHEFFEAVRPSPQIDLREVLFDDSSRVSRSASPEESPSGTETREVPTPSQNENSSITTDYGQRTTHALILATQAAPKFHGAIKSFVDDLKRRLSRGETIVCVVPTTGKVDRLREILNEYEIPFAKAIDVPAKSEASDAGTDADGSDRVPGRNAEKVKINSAINGSLPHEAQSRAGIAGPVLMARGRLSEGVALLDLNLLLLSDADLFGEFDWGSSGRKERSAASSFISDLSDLKVGDYVVHVDHGVGEYQGLRQLGVGGAERDFMLITYQEDAKLYVPLERLDLVEKYRSSDGAKPMLDRLGGVSWARTKARVKRALRDMAQELLQLYAERKMKGGVAYSGDTPWQKEFEEAFEFEETPDQLTALAEIKRDLESGQPMDRLLCGDVGYGKTELAMRAAFKVVQDSRQVALLAPTTVLAFQHFNTFRKRMAAFPVRVEMVSRFRTPAEQKKVLQETEAGNVDILIGTHRLLSKDIAFRDLGLLIVDEEQRFGVAAKERLKKMKAGVEVLTMSATPIPRTLNMSLGGLRDLSVIETPPRGRLAIQTVVAPFGLGVIQSAILQEVGREGQVYFVHNRVDSIFTMAEMIQKLVPTARIGVAHGQMGEKELERVMLKFIQGGYDVLVSTVLIENGLDIPRANTLIVNHAERFGLADLYQLRGRVGRSNRRAYAYLMIPTEETISPIAKRRLTALKEFSDLGAGFRLAALDLELRGAGNLLGAEQHGHLNSVGLDLYLKMLEQTVEELRGGVPKPEVRTTLNLGLDIKIPERYIADERQRLRMYKRISSLASPEQRADLEAEFRDRYGPIPDSVSNLFDYALLKSIAERLLVESIERKGDEVWLRFHSQAPLDPERLKLFVRRHRETSFRPNGVLTFRLPSHNGDLTLQVRRVLEELHSAPPVNG